MGKSDARESRRITLIALFGIAVFISKALLPSPLDKMLVIIQALFLALGSLLSRSLGATKVAAVGAALTSILRPTLASFTIAFSLIYGLLTDVFIFVFRVKAPEGEVRAKTLMATTTLSTAITGLASYYVTVQILALLPRNPILEVIILVVGMISGLVGGFLAALIWRNSLRHIVAMSSPKQSELASS